jgi:hypothetical protein
VVSVANKEFPIREPIIKVSDGSTYVDLSIKQIESDWKATITRVSVRNQTAAMSSIVIGVESRGSFLPVAAQPLPEANKLYWMTDSFDVFEGEKVTARFCGSSSGNILEANIYGYKSKLK